MDRIVIEAKEPIMAGKVYHLKDQEVKYLSDCESHKEYLQKIYEDAFFILRECDTDKTYILSIFTGNDECVVYESQAFGILWKDLEDLNPKYIQSAEDVNIGPERITFTMKTIRTISSVTREKFLGIGCASVNVFKKEKAVTDYFTIVIGYPENDIEVQINGKGETRVSVDESSEVQVPIKTPQLE